MIREEAMALFAGRLTNHAELHRCSKAFATVGAERESSSAVAGIVMIGFRCRCW